jgi:hypothetical protein
MCKLLKSFYGLKQAPKQQHERFDRTLTFVGFVVNELTNVCIVGMVGTKI